MLMKVAVRLFTESLGVCLLLHCEALLSHHWGLMTFPCKN